MSTILSISELDTTDNLFPTHKRITLTNDSSYLCNNNIANTLQLHTSHVYYDFIVTNGEITSYYQASTRIKVISKNVAIYPRDNQVDKEVQLLNSRYLIRHNLVHELEEELLQFKYVQTFFDFVIVRGEIIYFEQNLD